MFNKNYLYNKNDKLNFADSGKLFGSITQLKVVFKKCFPHLLFAALSQSVIYKIQERR